MNEKKNQGPPPGGVKQGGKKKKKRQTRADATRNGQLITPVDNITLAQGAIKEIPIAVQIDPISFYFIPIAQLTMGMIRNVKDPFAVYTAYYQDQYSLASVGVGQVTTRLNYFNEILAALCPKNVPFRGGSVYYSWLNIPTIPGPVLTIPDGFNYYMYVPSTTTSGVWATQVVPPAYSASEVTDAYSSNIEALGGNRIHNKVVRNVPLGTRYATDGSAFARVSPYYGTGAGVGSPYFSNELEVPFLSNLLSALVSFSSQQPRASRSLDYSSGDACSNYGIGALDVWNMSYYNGAVAPIYKFIDLAEIMHTLVQSVVSAIQKFITANAEIDSDTAALLTGGFGCTWSQYFIMLRQQILWMFADSQALAQFLSPQTGRGAFIPFVCGSNCYPKAQDIILNIPAVLNENLKCLKMCVRPYVTKNFNSPNNHTTHIPVIGAFAMLAPLQYFVRYADTDYAMFLPESDDPFVPSYFDGSGVSNVVVDFNATTLLQEIAGTHNAFVDLTANMWAPVAPIGGESRDSPFLQYTRFVQFNNDTQAEIHYNHRVPKTLRQYVIEKDVEVKLEKKNSLTKIEVPKKKKVSVFAPPNSTPYTESTAFITSTIPISATMKQNFGNFILPVIELSIPPSTALPSVAQIQTGSMEPFSFAGFTENPFATRGVEIDNGMINMVTGLAGRNSELADFVKKLASQNQGAFLGDLFAAAGAIIPGLSPITNIAGGIANALNL